MIRVSGLSAFYSAADGSRNVVLEDVNLHVPQGGTCAIIGPSGCGKSTFLRILAGIASNYNGEVLIAGRPADPKKMSIGFIPQNYGLLPWKTVGENIRLSWRVKHAEAPVPPEEERLLARIGIGSEMLDRFPGELSGGQQQRASLARAFLLRPDILLMDEPFSALDAITREEMQDVFLEMWCSNSVTTVLVTHDIEEAIYLGQTIAVLSSLPGQVRALIENPLFAGRKDSAALIDEIKKLRLLLTGEEKDR